MLPGTMAARRHAGTRARRAMFVTAALLFALLFVPMPRVLHTPVWRYAFDLGHAPLFAVLFLAALWLLGHRTPRAEVLAATLGVAAAGFSELLQLLTARSASLGDIGRDLLGVGLAWAGVVCWRRSLGWRAAYAAVVVGCIGVAGFLLGQRVVERRELAAMMPLLAGFERPFELHRWHAKDGTWMGRTAPGHAGTGWALEVRCATSEPWPGASMEDFHEDWRGYRWLEWSVRVPSGEPLELSVRLDDDQGAVHGTRYTKLVRVVPPQEVYRIDLRQVAAHFREHPMNMAAITELHLFLDEPRVERTFSLDEVRLVP